MDWVTDLDYWRETLLAGWLVGLAFGLFGNFPLLRTIFAGALAVVLLSFLVVGALCDEGEECAPGGAWGLIAAAGWASAFLLARAVRLGYSRFWRRDHRLHNNAAS